MPPDPKLDRTPTSPWRRPTRRVFVAMIGAAAAAIAARRTGLVPGGDAELDDDRPRSTWSGTTRWIGHC
jgi:hypothetical protein